MTVMRNRKQPWKSQISLEEGAVKNEDSSENHDPSSGSGTAPCLLEILWPWYLIPSLFCCSLSLFTACTG
jgi:hypothetical protein